MIIKPQELERHLLLWEPWEIENSNQLVDYLRSSSMHFEQLSQRPSSSGVVDVYFYRFGELFGTVSRKRDGSGTLTIYGDPWNSDALDKKFDELKEILGYRRLNP